jgi:chromosome segregation ATPase
MQQSFDIQQEPSNNAEVEYYRSLARVSEERAREIRRIAALERARLEERLLEQRPSLDAYAAELELAREAYERIKKSRDHFKDKSEHLKSDLATAKAQLKALKRAQAKIAQSRAHRVAETYVRYAAGKSVFAVTLRLARSFARVLHRVRRALKANSGWSA